jgi:protein-S-isoprenylcysteine O-methyltransferase Ste14
VESAISRETAIGIAVTAVALVAMVFDHLLGNDPGLEDPIAFVVAAVLTIACAIIVFVIVVPRTTGNIRSVEGTDRCANQPIVTAGVFALT